MFSSHLILSYAYKCSKIEPNPGKDRFDDIILEPQATSLVSVPSRYDVSATGEQIRSIPESSTDSNYPIKNTSLKV